MTDVLMPKLGLVMKEGEVTAWLKKAGEAVQEGEPLLEVTSEKITTVIESPASGTLLEIVVPEASKVPVGELIARIGAEGEAVSGPAAAPVAGERAAGPVRASPAAKHLARTEGVDLSQVSATRSDGVIAKANVAAFIESGEAAGVAATPLARRQAERAGVALEDVAGTGPRGKVTEQDVLAAAHPAPAAGAPAAVAMSEGEAVDELGRVYRRMPLSPLRKVMSRRMNESARTTAPCTITTELDLSVSRDLKGRLPFKASYTAIMAGAIARALGLHPDLNATLDGDELVRYRTVNLGIAVDTPDGLVVPSIASAETQTLRQITEALGDLAARARDGKLGMDDLSRGTFTVTNLGMFGVDRFAPVINLPEVAILGVGQMTDKVVELEGSFVTRPYCSLSLTFDHRVIDGAAAARFLATVKEFIENPYAWIGG